MVSCSHCGTEVSSGKFCTKCGELLQPGGISGKAKFGSVSSTSAPKKWNGSASTNSTSSSGGYNDSRSSPSRSLTTRSNTSTSLSRGGSSSDNHHHHGGELDHVGTAVVHEAEWTGDTVAHGLHGFFHNLHSEAHEAKAALSSRPVNPHDTASCIKRFFKNRSDEGLSMGSQFGGRANHVAGSAGSAGGGSRSYDRGNNSDRNNSYDRNNSSSSNSKPYRRY